MAISIKRKSPIGDPSLKNILVEIGRNSNDGEPNIDGAIFLLDSNGRVLSEEDLIFFGNPEHKSGAVIHFGTIEGNIEKIQIDLTKIPETIDRIEIVATVYDGDELQQDFSMSSSAFIRINETDLQIPLLEQNVQDFSIATARIIGEIYRRGSEWKFKTIGVGYSGGLAALCQQFGIEVDESPQEDSNLQINLKLNQKMVLKKIDRIRLDWNGKGEIGFFAELSDKSIIDNSSVENLNPAYATSELWLNKNLLTNANRILIYAAAHEYVLSILCPSMPAIRILVKELQSQKLCSIAQFTKRDETFVLENVTQVFEDKSRIVDEFGFKNDPPQQIDQPKIDSIVTNQSTIESPISKSGGVPRYAAYDSKGTSYDSDRFISPVKKSNAHSNRKNRVADDIRYIWTSKKFNA